MLKIEYEIKLNEAGRPCIDLSPDYEHRAEDKFFAIEMARYFFQVTQSRMTPEIYTQHTIDEWDRAIRLLGQLGDEMAEIIWNQMKANGDFELMTKRNYHVMVKSIEERDALPTTTGILEGSRIYLREEGLKVLVLFERKVYELQGGIENDNWVEINKFDDGTYTEI